jgi:hypothetical protein
MQISRRTRIAADVAVGYAADSRGHGIAYASVGTGTGTSVVRLAFQAEVAPALEGRELGYAVVAALGELLKSRGFGRVRIRLADERVAQELSGSGSPPKALAMAYVRVRCVLRALGAVRIEVAEPVEIRDLTARAQAEVTLRAAA